VIRELLNTLYVQTQGAYLHLHHETVRVEVDGVLRLQVPLHHLGGIAVFGNVLLSPFLIHRLAEDGRSLTWFSEGGRFRARIVGPISGNVLLRQSQYELARDPERAVRLARRFVWGKLRNSRQVLLRGLRESDETPQDLEDATQQLLKLLRDVDSAHGLDALRGVEGQGAAVYFNGFARLIRRVDFGWTGRSRRPPRDPINALLSFAYTLLVGDCVAACEGVGLDPQVGYLHALRPGRPALALDLAEEFRAPIVERLVLAIVNRRQLSPKDFEERPGGAIFMTNAARATVLEAYQRRKQEEVIHPLLQQRVPTGLLPHIQARLLARYMRGDIQDYVPYLVR
jgi:CRISPR-associated protein Cas1